MGLRSRSGMTTRAPLTCGPLPGWCTGRVRGLLFLILTVNHALDWVPDGGGRGAVLTGNRNRDPSRSPAGLVQ